MLDSRVIQSGNITLISLFDRELEKPMVAVQDYAADVVRFYTDQMGFYPHNYLVILPGAQKPCYGGCALDTGVIAIHALDAFSEMGTDYWRWITAHEIAHMYWGYHVYEGDVKTGKQLGWLTIALGIFLDKWYVDARGIKADFHEEVLQSYLNLKTSPENTSFDLPNDRIAKLDFDYNTIVLHGKAYHIIKQIETAIGRDTFVAAYKKMVRSFAGRKITYKGMLQFIMEETGMTVEVDAR